MMKALWVGIQVLAWCLTTVYLIAGKVLAPVMVAVGIWTGWPKWCWPWNAMVNKKSTGTYYDGWYANIDSTNHTPLSRWAWNKDGFWREYYWRNRNGFSNGMRYAFPFTEAKDICRTQWKYGFYEYDTQHKWMARIRCSYPIGLGLRITFYVGFKIDRTEGSGFTNRLPFRIRRDD